VAEEIGMLEEDAQRLCDRLRTHMEVRVYTYGEAAFMFGSRTRYWVNGSLDLAARAIVLQAFLFDEAKIGAA